MTLPLFSKNQRGFTLVELLVVISVIAILMGIGAASYTRVQRSGRDSQRQADLKLIAAALEQYYGEAGNNAYPGSTLALTPTYLNELPKDPITNADYTYHPTTTTTPTGTTIQTFCLIADLENNPDPADFMRCPGDTTDYEFVVSSRD